MRDAQGAIGLVTLLTGGERKREKEKRGRKNSQMVGFKRLHSLSRIGTKKKQAVADSGGTHESLIR